MSEAWQEPHKLVGDKYSPNLRRWLTRNRRWMNNLPLVYRWRDGGLYIGRKEADDNWFSGARLWGVLSGGKSGVVYAHPPGWAQHLVEIEGFWQRYAETGRCAIDPEHSRGFIGDETRWQINGDHRSCLWCGECQQTLHRWTEQVNRSAWRPAA